MDIKELRDYIYDSPYICPICKHKFKPHITFSNDIESNNRCLGCDALLFISEMRWKEVKFYYYGDSLNRVATNYRIVTPLEWKNNAN